jgi:drug/metabolite transporter (DMT)-like permease
MAWLCFFGSVFGSVGVVASGETFVIPDIQSLVFLVTYGIVCSSVGWYLITKGLPRVSISVAGLSLILQPALAFIWDVLFFEKSLTLLNSLGAVVTIMAIYLGVVSRSD